MANHEFEIIHPLASACFYRGVLDAVQSDDTMTSNHRIVMMNSAASTKQVTVDNDVYWGMFVIPGQKSWV